MIWLVWLAVVLTPVERQPVPAWAWVWPDGRIQIATQVRVALHLREVLSWMAPPRDDPRAEFILSRWADAELEASGQTRYDWESEPMFSGGR